MHTFFSRRTVTLGTALILAAAHAGAATTQAPLSWLGATPSTASPRAVVMSPQLAARFLGQATFGPSPGAIDELGAVGAPAWLTSQFQKPQTLHRSYMDAAAALLPAGTELRQNQFFESFWKQAVSADDPLRQRVAFALSEIFVVSFQNSANASYPRGMASYYDMLGRDAFGNFRTLLQDVALHPMMGIYLSHLHNQKESGNRVPDENFAREVMQLFTIGLYALNADGSLRTNNGQPIETYSHADVAALAKVFTGWSWGGPDLSRGRFWGSVKDADRDWKPMQMYPEFHSGAAKQFLGASIGTGTAGDADLKVALDTLFNHPNVGPFIGRQLIQRLVTSNPSPDYVGRVAAAFANNGAGVRGDMKAVIKAVLLDAEARDQNSTRGASVAKLREPLVRLAQWMRAFNATSTSGHFLLGTLDDPLSGLAQTPMRSPSVFNFFRPGYVPPNTPLASAGLVAPEMQITAEPSVTGYLNFMQDVIPRGLGTARDVLPHYEAELALAATPELLLDRTSLLLLGGPMSAALRTQVLGAINAVKLPVPTSSNAAAVAAAKLNRVCMAIYLTMAAPEYLVQK